MRYYLEANGLEAEVFVSLSGPDQTTVTTVLKSEDGLTERQFVLMGDSAHEVCEDGSYRRRTLLVGNHDPREWKFFHSGRVRTVLTVGGAGGHVESLESQGSVKAPMNGQVVKVAKQVGERIESGEIVLILEAMKMENEVTAPISGVLTDLKVQPGESVSPGQLLFCVEAAD